jgi:hypothetical protein|tara:strand:- start:5981 stop:6751 length:771 start_codon:yes stop_codon:yes gene_type:complete
MTVEEEENRVVVPKMVFIVPYRDRILQKDFFIRHMKYILEDIPEEEYKIFFLHQCDTRDFNRGAMKNCGFLAIKDMYPNDYKNITLIFNDVDTLPYVKNFFNYGTTRGIVKHFYGFTFALGGIVSITGGDFELIGGFPNFWGWGYEDNLIQKRVLANKCTIDRNTFIPILDKNMIHLCDGKFRTIHRNEYTQFHNNTNEGFQSIVDLQYNTNDVMINITNFSTGRKPNPIDRRHKDLSKGSPFSKRNPLIGMKLNR